MTTTDKELRELATVDCPINSGRHKGRPVDRSKDCPACGANQSQTCGQWVSAMQRVEKLLPRLLDENAKLRGENEDLKSSVIAFCALWVVTYARDRGLPPGHLYPTHYDILAKCGARMVDFTRADLGE